MLHLPNEMIRYISQFCTAGEKLQLYSTTKYLHDKFVQDIDYYKRRVIMESYELIEDYSSFGSCKKGDTMVIITDPYCDSFDCPGESSIFMDTIRKDGSAWCEQCMNDYYDVEWLECPVLAPKMYNFLKIKDLIKIIDRREREVMVDGAMVEYVDEEVGGYDVTFEGCDAKLSVLTIYTEYSTLEINGVGYDYYKSKIYLKRE